MIYKKKKHRIFKAFLWGYAIISFYPLLWMLFYSLKNNDEIFFKNPFGFPTTLRFENYINAFSRYNVFNYFKNSVVVTVGTIAIAILFSLMFAYATTRLIWKLRDVTRLYIVAGMFIPVQAIMIPLSVLVRDLHLKDTYLSLIIPYAAFNLGFSTLVFYAFFKTIPKELEEACCIDGASINRTFFYVILPIMKPAIATMIIFIFLNSWNEFTMALILINKEALKTLPLGVLFFQGEFTTDWGGMGAAMVIASFPTVIMYILFSKQVEKALTTAGAVKG